MCVEGGSVFAMSVVWSKRSKAGAEVRGVNAWPAGCKDMIQSSMHGCCALGRRDHLSW